VTQYSIPYNSNLRYLPLVFFLPEELIAKCPTLRALPRNLGAISRSDRHINAIQSDAFLLEIMDAAAGVAFPHFGFGGWKEHYTGYCPVWQLSYALPLWTKLLEEADWGLQGLFQMGGSHSIPFFDTNYIKEVMRKVVKRAIVEQGWQPILDTVKEMPCDEDFEKWDTNVRKDFLRKLDIISVKVLEKLGFVYDRDDITPHVDGFRLFDSREYLLELE